MVERVFPFLFFASPEPSTVGGREVREEGELLWTPVNALRRMGYYKFALDDTSY